MTTNPHQNLIESSINWRNFQAIKEKENRLAEIECQLWSDPKLKNHLDFTETPPLPTYKPIVVKRGKVWWKVLFRECLP